MNWIALILLIIVFLFTVYLVRTYAIKSTPWHVYIFVFIGWFLAFSIVILVPYDVYAAISETMSDSQKSIAYELWRVIYWVVFVLCWAILPVI
jgi:hypothetical protein